MGKVSLNKTKKMVEVEVEVVEPVLNLELNKEQAVFLVEILRNIGGPLRTTPRKFGSEILKEIEEAFEKIGVEDLTLDDSDELLDVNYNNTIYWKDDSLGDFEKEVKRIFAKFK